MEFQIEQEICEISCLVEKPEEESEYIIRDCESTNSSEVVICARALLQLPMELFRLTWLKVLWLSSNILFDLPHELSNLVNLEVLGLQWNHLDNADVAFSLPQLKYLDLSHNNLTTLPSGTWGCRKLQHLFLSNNSLRDIPYQIGSMVELVKFEIANNKLERLPVSIGNLQKLQSPCSLIRGNHLRFPPRNVPATDEAHLCFLRLHWLQIPQFQRHRLLHEGVSACSMLNLQVVCHNKSYTVVASAASLCELSAEIWHLLDDYHSMKLPQLECYDHCSQCWRQVMDLEQLHSSKQVRVVSSEYELQNNIAMILQFEKIIEEVQRELNFEASTRHWKGMASRLGYTDAALLSSWEQSANPAKCVIHTWLSSSQDANLNRLQEVLQQLQHEAARVPVQSSEAC